MFNKEEIVLRELAKKYLEICNKDIMDKRRELWRKHNNLEETRVPILCSWHWLSNVEKYEMFVNDCVNKDPILMEVERFLRNMIYHDKVNDDYVFEPWVTVPAVQPPWDYVVSSVKSTESWCWEKEKKEKNEKFETSASNPESFVAKPSIKTIDDIYQNLKVFPHIVDEDKTQKRYDKVFDIIGDIIGVSMDRRPMLLWTWGGSDISTSLGSFLGLENQYLYMIENQDLVHELAKFMMEGVLKVFDQAEKAGDWHPNESQNTNMGISYCDGFPDPVCNGRNYKMKDLWLFSQAQEFTGVSPKMQEEFAIQYQRPIMEKFGLVSYGCCEDQSNKVEILKKIPNLRRIGQGPYGNIEKTAEQTGKDYILSWKPKPSMVGPQFDLEYIRDELESGYKQAKSKDAVLDIMLKDIGTVEKEKERLIEWTRIAREVTGSFE